MMPIRLNAIVADVKSFQKEGPDGTRFWLHVHADSVDFVPRILDLIIETYLESVAAHGKSPGHADYHVIEADDRHQAPFNSAGLLVVPRGSFRAPDKPTVAGVLTPELNKAWARTPCACRRRVRRTESGGRLSSTPPSRGARQHVPTSTAEPPARAQGAQPSTARSVPWESRPGVPSPRAPAALTR